MIEESCVLKLPHLPLNKGSRVGLLRRNNSGAGIDLIPAPGVLIRFILLLEYLRKEFRHVRPRLFVGVFIICHGHIVLLTLLRGVRVRK